MGCDYYISKYLEVMFHSNGPCFIIELELDRGYFHFTVEEDEPNYDQLYEDYVLKTLENIMSPIIIFKDNQFVNNNLKNKYKDLIDFELNNLNKNRDNKMNWKDIKLILKKESRYERD